VGRATIARLAALTCARGRRSHVVRPRFDAVGSQRFTTSSAAVWPVTAKHNLFWMVAKKVLAASDVPS